jgi:hypothetical protein
VPDGLGREAVRRPPHERGPDASDAPEGGGYPRPTYLLRAPHATSGCEGVEVPSTPLITRARACARGNINGTPSRQVGAPRPRAIVGFRGGGCPASSRARARARVRGATRHTLAWTRKMFRSKGSRVSGRFCGAGRVTRYFTVTSRTDRRCGRSCNVFTVQRSSPQAAVWRTARAAWGVKAAIDVRLAASTATPAAGRRYFMSGRRLPSIDDE